MLHFYHYQNGSGMNELQAVAWPDTGGRKSLKHHVYQIKRVVCLSLIPGSIPGRRFTPSCWDCEPRWANYRGGISCMKHN